MTSAVKGLTKTRHVTLKKLNSVISEPVVGFLWSANVRIEVVVVGTGRKSEDQISLCVVLKRIKNNTNNCCLVIEFSFFIPSCSFLNCESEFLWCQ